jgi:hypothetical protein
LLDQLQGSRQIPFLAIFPAGHPEKAIRIPGLYNQSKLLKELENAGPSSSKAVRAGVAEETSEPTVILSNLP